MSTISAGTTTGTALVSTGDTSGNLVLQVNGTTTAVTLNTAGAVGVGSSPSYGTSGQVLTSAGSAAAPTWGNAAVAANLQEFTSSGTWTKPTGATFVMVEAWGAGGGGGSGCRGASNTIRAGGGGGGGGAYATRVFKASAIADTVKVTVGAGGPGGVAATTNTSNGQTGTAGGNSSFGLLLTAFGGTGGGGAYVTGGYSNAGIGGGVLWGGGTWTPDPRSVLGNPNTSDRLAGAFGPSRPSGNGYYPGAGHGGGSGGYMAGSPYYAIAGECSYQGGGGGGCGGTIDSGNSLYYGGTASGGEIGNAVGYGPQGTVGEYYTQSTTKGLSASGQRYGGTGGGAADGSNYTANYASTCAYGNSTFIIVHREDFDYGLSTSTNSGSTWTFKPAPLKISNLVWDGAKWVVISLNGYVSTTTDFVTYTALSYLGFNLRTIAYAGGKYVIVGDSTAAYWSTDLVNWTPAETGSSTGQVNHVINDGTRWMACGTGGEVFVSTDAITWTKYTISGSPNLYHVAYGNSKHVVGASNGSYAYYSTNNGASWTACTGVSATAAVGLAWTGARFVITGGSNLWTSSDGITFTQQADGVTDALGTAGYGNCVASDGTTIVCPQYTSTPGSIAITSTDNGASWTSRTVSAYARSAAGTGGTGGIAGGGGGGGASLNGYNSGAGGPGGNGLVRVYSW